MQLRKILCVLFVLITYLTYAQQDSLRYHLDSIKVKGVKRQQTIYNAKKISTFNLETHRGKDLARQLANLPGVQVRESGANITKPIIDGVSSSRLVYTLDGVKLENQDWADVHPPEIDADLSHSISVVRGAESVKYGANAIGGVVVSESGKIPDETNINGFSRINYSTNTRGFGGTFSLQQNLKTIEGLKWRIKGSAKKNGDYHSTDYNVGNSGSRVESWAGTIQYKNKKLELESNYTGYHSKLGNYFGALTGNIEEFEDRIDIGRPLIELPFTYKIQAPYIDTKHHIFNIKGKYNITPRWNLSSEYSYQINIKDEFDVRRGDRTGIPVQDMDLTSKSWNVDINYRYKKLKSTFGVQLKDKENVNNPGTGRAPVLPNYIYKQQSAYTYHNYKLNRWDLNAGIRYDQVKMNAKGFNFLGQEYGNKKDFSALSAQLATNYQGFSFRFNSSLSYAWRVPEAYELYANGKQHGAPIYFVGNSDFNGEKALKFMNSFEFEQGITNFQLHGFTQLYDGYIYAIPTHEYKQLFSGPAAIFQFKQQDAIILGIDFINHWHLTKKLDFKYQLSWIKGTETKTQNTLPNISPFRTSANLGYDVKLPWKSKKSRIEIEHQWVAQKKNFNPAYELSSFIPKAYHLTNISLKTNYLLGHKTELVLSLHANNIFNTLYKNYLNLQRYFVHNMGRNININLQFNF